LNLMPEISESTPSTVAVFGLGYVGSVTGACLASIGHRVVGIDSDRHKVECLNSGKAPFFEPGLEEIIRKCTVDGRLSASISVEEVLGEAEVALICVGTPSERSGEVKLAALRGVIVDGRACTSFDEDSVTLVRSPAEVICTTS